MHTLFTHTYTRFIYSLSPASAGSAALSLERQALAMPSGRRVSGKQRVDTPADGGHRRGEGRAKREEEAVITKKARMCKAEGGSDQTKARMCKAGGGSDERRQRWSWGWSWRWSWGW